MHASSSQATTPRSFDRKSLPFYAGALADTAVGVGLIAFADSLAPMLMPEQATILGIAVSSVLRFLGVFLLVFAFDTVLVARSKGTLSRFRSWIVGANWATVALAVAVIAAWHALFSPIGVAAVAVVAVAVATFATLQHKSI